MLTKIHSNWYIMKQLAWHIDGVLRPLKLVNWHGLVQMGSFSTHHFPTLSSRFDFYGILRIIWEHWKHGTCYARYNASSSCIISFPWIPALSSNVFALSGYVPSNLDSLSCHIHFWTPSYSQLFPAKFAGHSDHESDYSNWPIGNFISSARSPIRQINKDHRYNGNFYFAIEWLGLY